MLFCAAKSALKMADSHSSEPSTSSVQSDTRQKQVVSLLDRLKQPDSSDLSRKRKITANKAALMLRVNNR